MPDGDRPQSAANAEPMNLASVSRVEPDRFLPRELSEVCSRYELGRIDSIREFHRGSPLSPKVIVEAARGKFLLKRRSPQTSDPFRVAFVHGIQLFLHAHGFPVPAIIGTRDGNNSICQHEGMVYELFRFVEGEPFAGGGTETASAGETLGQLHRLIVDHRPAWTQAKQALRTGLDVDLLLDATAEREPACKDLVKRIHRPVTEAGKVLDRSSLSSRPTRIIHGDWHPGNLINRGGTVVAVLDFDSARFAPPLIELANGLLQFSMTRMGTDPARWPFEPDRQRVQLFWNGYLSVKPDWFEPDDSALVPWLMIELLVSEALRPIVQTGRFGHLDAVTCLKMVERKCAWLRENAASLSSLLPV